MGNKVAKGCRWALGGKATALANLVVSLGPRGKPLDWGFGTALSVCKGGWENYWREGWGKWVRKRACRLGDGVPKMSEVGVLAKKLGLQILRRELED